MLQVVTGNVASFTVDTKGLDGELDIRVTGPDGGQIPARLVKLRSGLHRAEYRADQVTPLTCTLWYPNLTCMIIFIYLYFIITETAKDNKSHEKLLICVAMLAK